MEFANKVAIITGAAGGIGKAVAIQMAKQGARLVLADQKTEESKKTLEELKNITENVEFIIGDLTKESTCQTLIDTAILRFDKIDILINNVGITGTPAPVHLMSEEMFRHVLDSNIMIAFYCSKLALPHMMEAKTGSIVNVASVAGMTGFPGHSAYVTSKHGLNGLTRNMALDYAPYNIRVNSVNPGTTQTPMLDEAKEFLAKKAKNSEGEPSMSGKMVSPQNRTASADEVANVITFLASEKASNVTGAIVPVDGGFTAF